MPTEAETKQPGRVWSEGARLLQIAMTEHKINQTQLRERLKGRNDRPPAEGLISRWVHGERRPSRLMSGQLRVIFGIPDDAWDWDARGPWPFGNTPKPEAA